MHKIHAKEFTLEDFSTEHLGVTIPAEKNDGEECYQNLWPEIMKGVIEALNIARRFYIRETDPELKKDYWWQMIQLLPSSYNQTRNVMMNYEVLANIYKSRKNHKLDEWRELCSWIESLPYSELITGTAGSLETKYIFGEPFPWTKEAGERLKAETDGIIKAAVDKELHSAIIPDSNQSSFSVKDLEEAMKHYDPNDGVKTHVTMMKED